MTSKKKPTPAPETKKLNYAEFEEAKAKLNSQTMRPPFSGQITVEDGMLYMDGDVVLMPTEAARLGRWILEFYGEDFR